MSNALAIASVTRFLKDLLHDALVNGNVSSDLGEDVTVTALPPDRVLGNNGAGENTQLNIFLHQITPNAAWRNVDLPTRNHRGDRINTPLLAVNLHYLLTAYGAEELHAEILLGYAMQLFHENPMMGREDIRSALAIPPIDPPGVDGSILPAAFHSVAASELADQVEMIKITPETLTMDDMSKVWTALQTHYRTTVGYLVTVVLIESRAAKRTPLPVLTRGAPDLSTGRDAGVAVQPNLLPPFPTLQGITPANEQIAARMGETVTLSGHHLGGDQITVRFSDMRSHRVLDLAASGAPTDTRVDVQIPPDPPAGPVTPESPDNPENWQAGLYNIQLIIASGGRPPRESNELPMQLAPTIAAVNAAAAGPVITFTVTARPPVRDTQRISLIVGDRELPAQPLAASPTATVAFQGQNFNSGAVLPVRLRIDGVDSILIDRSHRPPRFDPSQQVTIP